MKNFNCNKLKTFAASVLSTCLIIGSITPAAAVAAVGDLPEKGWDRLIGGTSRDQFNRIAVCDDSGAVSVGGTIDAGRIDFDGFIVKTDVRGSIIWRSQPGGVGEDMLDAVIELDDGTILAAGYSRSSNSGLITDMNNGREDGLLIKYSAAGQKMWDKLIGGTGNDFFSDVIETADGGFLAVGRSNSDAGGDIADSNNGNQTLDGYIVKFDEAGNVEWDNLYGSPEHEAFYRVVETSDGGYIAAGYAASMNHINTGGEITDVGPGGLMPHDGLLVKFDAAGNMVWNNLYGSTNADDFTGIVPTDDGGCVVIGGTSGVDEDLSAGSAEGIAGLCNGLVAKFDSEGSPIWSRTFARGDALMFKDIVKAPDDGYIVAGSVIGNPGSYGREDGFLAKVGNDGSLVEMKNIGGEGYDNFYGLAIDGDGILTASGSGTSSQSGSILSKSNGGQDGLVVRFSQAFYHVMFEENGGSAVSDQVIEFGSPMVEPEPTIKAGHVFQGWFVDAACTEEFSIMAPIIQDTTLYAKWYRHVAIHRITTDDRTIGGTGEPNFLVVVTLPDGVEIETYAEENGSWEVKLPKNQQLKRGEVVKATMYDVFHDGVMISSDEETVSRGTQPPSVVDPPSDVATPMTSDLGSTAIIALFGLFLGLMIMIAAFKGPKAYR